MFFNVRYCIKSYLIKIVFKRTRLILIVSSGRTGTKFFESLLTKIFPNSPVYHEPKPDLFDLSVEKIRFGASERMIKKEIFRNRANLLYDKYSFLELFEVILNKSPVYVESNPFIFPVLQEFSSLFKNTQYIYITRNIETYIISAYNKDPLGNGLNNFYAKSDKRERLTPVDLKNMTVDEWQNLKRIEKIAWYWNWSNKEIYNFLNADKNFLHIKFEKIFSNQQISRLDEIKRLLDFLKCNEINPLELEPHLNAKVNTGKNLSTLTQFTDLNDLTVENIRKLGGEMSLKLNYNL